jgi:hypothetical protein
VCVPPIPPFYFIVSLTRVTSSSVYSIQGAAQRALCHSCRGPIVYFPIRGPIVYFPSVALSCISPSVVAPVVSPYIKYTPTAHTTAATPATKNADAARNIHSLLLTTRPYTSWLACEEWMLTR